jgi:hypothetical protein
MTHVPLLRLERFVARDLPAPEAEEVRAHANECAACQRRIDALRADDEDRLARVPPRVFVRRLRRPRRAWVLAIAVAAAAGVVFSLHAQPTRWKGAGLIVHLQRDGQVRRLEEGDGIRAGDSLRVSLVIAEPTRARVWLADAGGAATTLADGALPAGEQLLEGAVTVTPPCRDVTVFATTAEGTISRRLRCE